MNTKNTVVEQLYEVLKLTEGQLSKEYIYIVLEDIKTFDKKQHDYGPGNIAGFGEQGVLVRVSDKIARVKNLICLLYTSDAADE